MRSQLPGRAAGGGHEKDIEVAVAVTRKGNPFSIGRKARIRVACLVDRQALNILAVLVRRPDVGEIGERDAPVRVTGIANELCLAGENERGQRENEQSYGERVEFLHGFLLLW